MCHEIALTNHTCSSAGQWDITALLLWRLFDGISHDLSGETFSQKWTALPCSCGRIVSSGKSFLTVGAPHSFSAWSAASKSFGKSKCSRKDSVTEHTNWVSAVVNLRSESTQQVLIICRGVWNEIFLTSNVSFSEQNSRWCRFRMNRETIFGVA